MSIGTRRHMILMAASLLAIGASALLVVERSPGSSVPKNIVALAVSASGQWLASGTGSGRILIWDLDRRRAVREVQRLSGTLNALQFDPAGEYLVVSDRNITLVPVSNPGRTRTIRDDGANYGTVRFSSDGRTLLTINGQGVILAIPVGTGGAQAQVCCSTIYGEVAFSPDDAFAIVAGHWPAIWDLRTGQLAGRLTEARKFMAFGPIAMDARRGLLYLGSQDGRVHVWDLLRREYLRASLPQQGYVSTIALLGATGWIAYAAQGEPVRLWNLEKGESRVVPAARSSSNLVFDAARHRTALGTNSGSVEFWDLVEGRILGTLP